MPKETTVRLFFVDGPEKYRIHKVPSYPISGAYFIARPPRELSITALKTCRCYMCHSEVRKGMYQQAINEDSENLTDSGGAYLFEWKGWID